VGPIFVYFDYDESGYVALNAKELQEMAADPGL
jgi:hypothetical protein